MGLETLLIIVGITFKWILYPNTVQNQEAIGHWTFTIGCILLVLELLFVFCLAFAGSRR